MEAYVTHNHLKEETSYSFSKADIKLFEKYKLNVLRGIDYKYTYELNKNILPELKRFLLKDVEDENILEHANSIDYALQHNISYRRWKND